MIREKVGGDDYRDRLGQLRRGIEDELGDEQNEERGGLRVRPETLRQRREQKWGQRQEREREKGFGVYGRCCVIEDGKSLMHRTGLIIWYIKSRSEYGKAVSWEGTDNLSKPLGIVVFHTFKCIHLSRLHNSDSSAFLNLVSSRSIHSSSHLVPIEPIACHRISDTHPRHIN